MQKIMRLRPPLFVEKAATVGDAALKGREGLEAASCEADRSLLSAMFSDRLRDASEQLIAYT